MGGYSQREMVCELHKRKLRVRSDSNSSFFVFFGNNVQRWKFQALETGCSGLWNWVFQAFETGCSRLWNWVFQALKLGVSGFETGCFRLWNFHAVRRGCLFPFSRPAYIVRGCVRCCSGAVRKSGCEERCIYRNSSHFGGFNTNGKMNWGNWVAQSFGFYKPECRQSKPTGMNCPASQGDEPRRGGGGSHPRGRNAPSVRRAAAIMPFCFPCGVVTTLLFALRNDTWVGNPSGSSSHLPYKGGHWKSPLFENTTNKMQVKVPATS